MLSHIYTRIYRYLTRTFKLGKVKEIYKPVKLRRYSI